MEKLNQYLNHKIQAAQSDVIYFSETNDEYLLGLAYWYLNLFEETKTTLNDRFKGDIIGAFKQLQNEGYIEIMTSTATHAYLPLLDQESSVYGQIKTGIESHKRIFETQPTVMWLPECAYRPQIKAGDTVLHRGFEEFLAEQGIKVFFTETHTITGGKPVGVAAGDVIGPGGEIKNRYVVPTPNDSPKRRTTTYNAYYVTSYPQQQNAQHSGVAVIGRNNNSGQQVWSNEWGYPGDFDYREFHKKAGTSGLQYWRVTGDDVTLDKKDYYHPDWAKYKTDQHAEHYAHLIWDLLRENHHETGDYGVVASIYNTELFGHWWFEGVEWLGKIIQHIVDNADINMTTVTEYITEHPPQDVLALPESSWGLGGNHFTWDNGETNWMWQLIHEAERRMEILVENFQNPTDDERYVLNQTARELLLMQSSDWQSLITTNQAREYASQRFHQHLERFNKLADSLDIKQANRALAEELWELDKVFPQIDYTWFQKR